jgi:hypothetical protein
MNFSQKNPKRNNEKMESFGKKGRRRMKKRIRK